MTHASLVAERLKLDLTRLAAIMSVYAAESVLTFNSVDFARFTNVRAIHPSSLVP